MSNNTNVPVIDVALLRKTLDHIESHQDEWNQTYWRVKEHNVCGTAMCFAGHAAHIMDCEWATHDEEYVVANEADIEWVANRRYADILVHEGETYIHCSYRAERQLGLSPEQRSQLFAPHNSLKDLQRLVAQYEEEAYSDEQ